MTALKPMVVLSAAGGAAILFAPIAPASAAVPLLVFLAHAIIDHPAVAAAASLASQPVAASSYYGGAPAYNAPPPSTYPSAPAYYRPPAPAYYTSGPAYDTHRPAYYAYPPAYYGRTPAYYPQRQVYYVPPRGYYRSEVLYSRSLPRAYEAARRYDAPRANYRGYYAYGSAGRSPGFAYRR